MAAALPPGVVMLLAAESVGRISAPADWPLHVQDICSYFEYALFKIYGRSALRLALPPLAGPCMSRAYAAILSVLQLFQSC